MDAYGARSVLLISLISSAVCYGMVGSAASMALLHASRLPTLFQHAVLAARALATQRSSEAGRASAIGLVGVAYGVGFAAGPALGGWLAGGRSPSASDLQRAAWVAVALSVAGAAAVMALLPDVGSAEAAGAGGGSLSGPGAVLAASKAAAAAGGSEAGASGAGGGGQGPPQKWASPLGRLSLRELLRVASLPGVPSLLAIKVWGRLSVSGGRPRLFCTHVRQN